MKAIIACTAFSLLLTVNSIAQKLPGKQDKSIRAPANIKIDGIASEWNNKFQAHNYATDISYIIANDDEKLYIAVNATYRDIIDKILRGGITFTINHTLKKKDEKPVTITYPFIRDEGVGTVTNTYLHNYNEKRDAGTETINVTSLNEILGKTYKLINVTGVVEIAEPQISIYNAIGIKAASEFDEHLAYTIEMAIPLKYLALPNNGADSFSYQIKINEPAEVKKRPSVSSGSIDAPPPMAITSFSATDFWGEYTLAK
jgi:hypothetical protein